MSVIDWLYENDPETRGYLFGGEYENYDGLADPTRFKWDIDKPLVLNSEDGFDFTHISTCNGDHSDVSGRCETDPIE